MYDAGFGVGASILVSRLRVSDLHHEAGVLKPSILNPKMYEQSGFVWIFGFYGSWVRGFRVP